jgi:hypothetical protein
LIQIGEPAVTIWSYGQGKTKEEQMQNMKENTAIFHKLILPVIKLRSYLRILNWFITCVEQMEELVLGFHTLIMTCSLYLEKEDIMLD